MGFGGGRGVAPADPNGGGVFRPSGFMRAIPDDLA